MVFSILSGLNTMGFLRKATVNLTVLFFRIYWVDRFTGVNRSFVQPTNRFSLGLSRFSFASKASLCRN